MQFDWYWRAVHWKPSNGCVQTVTLASLSTAVSCPKLLKQWFSRIKGGPTQIKGSLPHVRTHTTMWAYHPHLPVDCYWSPCSTSFLSWVISSFFSAQEWFGLGWGYNSGGKRSKQGHDFLPLIIFSPSLTYTYAPTHNIPRKTCWKVFVPFLKKTFTSRICAPVLTLKATFNSHVAYLFKFTSGENRALWNCGAHIILNRGSWQFKRLNNGFVTECCRFSLAVGKILESWQCTRWHLPFSEELTWSGMGESI